MSGEEGDPRDLVPAAFAGSEFEAQTKAAVLRAEGIDARVLRTGLWPRAGLGAGAPGVPVWVQRADAERARALLEEPDETPEVDWEQVDVGERQDRVPLRPVGHLPLPAKLGFVVAAVIVAVFVAVAVIALTF